MANKTSYLKFILPALGEYKDAWWEPVNENFTSADEELERLATELTDAKHTSTTLKAFLDVGHNTDGTLKATDEVVEARNSPVYEDQVDLKDRLNAADLEILSARERSTTLREALAARSFLLPKAILDGSKDSNGYPTWFGFTGSKANIDGGGTELVLLINGHMCRVRSLRQVDLVGQAAGTYYIYAEYQANGIQILDGDSATPPPLTANGVTSNGDDSKPRRFSDATQDFENVVGVLPGDVLNILNTTDSGSYYVKTVNPTTSDPSQLDIAGLFPQGGLASIDYTISDPLGVNLAFSTSEPSDDTKICLGEVVFDGTSITSYKPRHFKDTFVGEWRAVTGGNFSEVWNHQLGSINLEVAIQVSQVNTGLGSVEELSQAALYNDVAYTPENGSLGVSSTIGTPGNLATALGGTADPHVHALTGSPNAALTGTVGGSIANNTRLTHSVRAKWDKNTVSIKNAVSGVFYTDYDDNVRATGYIRVVVRKKGY
jgi:hypothetical protein